MQQLSVRRGIIVFSGRFSNLGKALFQEVTSIQLLVEHFRDEELLVDITGGCLPVSQSYFVLDGVRLASTPPF